jgi:hypothetical protein
VSCIVVQGPLLVGLGAGEGGLYALRTQAILGLFRERPVTRQEAQDIIESISKGPRELERTLHFFENCAEEGFTTQDVNAILKSHRLESAPAWLPATQAFRVRLLGKCLEGRPARVVLDLRADGPCVLVTIMENKQLKNRRTR